ncbi:MFS transporter [Micromonospora peucetia]|uniref:MFS transporter n=1 Tax=Micromonospora peucetia TaxID=47871 RepID=A0A1C6UWC4_9ACTN|nr:MFS transporter [Micromonospora peucetia]WSA34916.1 MFS transporter [Micromonospora peucetia]SCL58129.1 Predicted arabinose efflux permease, MFS family [Micromonospora peucetia]
MEPTRTAHLAGGPLVTGVAAPTTAPVAGRRTALAVLLAGSLLTVLAGAVLTPVVELIRTELRISGTAAGLVLTAHGLSLALAGPLVGRAIDRWGVRTPLALGLILYGLAGGAGLATDSYPLLIATRLLFGVGAALVFAGTTLGLLDLHEGAARDRTMGWRSTAISLGGVLFPLLGGVLGGISWHAPFGVYLLGVPLGLVTLWALPGRRAANASGDVSAGRPGRSGSLWNLLRGHPALVGIYGLQAVTSLLLYGVLVFLPLRLAEVGITETAVVAVFTGTPSLVMSIVGLGYPRIRARLGQLRLLAVTLAVFTAALITLGLTGAPVLMLVAPAVFGIGMGLAVPALTVMVAEHAPPARRGQATALLASATFAGLFVSPLLLGSVQAATSTRGTFLAAAALSGATLALLVVRLRGGSGRRQRGGRTAARRAGPGPTPDPGR